VRRALSIVVVVLAALTGAIAALGTFTYERELSVGTVHLESDLAHDGALDLYVPLVDWGVRFGAVRLPVRLRVDVRTIDRQAAVRLGQAGRVDVAPVRAEAADAVEGYIRRVVLVVAAAALLAGVLAAAAIRGPALRWLLGTAVLTAVLCAGAIVLWLPPRGDLGTPEFYAHGPDIPRALEAVQGVAASAQTLRDELDAQLVGLAQLVTAPGTRSAVTGLPRATIASDLHNNLVSLPTLAGAAEDGPLLFVGDLTDTGTPLETALTRRVVRSGRPFLFAPGNHDSDVMLSRLVREGAIVLGARGRLLASGARGEVVVRAGGLRVAGYDDPNQRQRADGYRDRGTVITDADTEAFAAWLRTLLGRVDVVMVHNPKLLRVALEELRATPPATPLVFAVGHTHAGSIERVGANVTVVNGGTVGAGGTGNLGEGLAVGLAQVAYSTGPFAPITADLVEIDPDSGSSRAERVRLDVAP
jgi:predicted phosphodiesterase